MKKLSKITSLIFAISLLLSTATLALAISAPTNITWSQNYVGPGYRCGNVSWNAVSGAVQYNVVRQKKISGVWTDNGWDKLLSGTRISNCTYGSGSYRFKVKAKNSSGTWSSWGYGGYFSF